jgi:hypothetical protein
MAFLRSFFGGNKTNELAETKKTPLDMVIYASGLVSDPHLIDPLLDEVRIISANAGSDQTTTPADTQKLLNVYLQLEGHLTTKEPLRSFTKQELRTHFTPELLQQLETYEKAINNINV